MTRSVVYSDKISKAWWKSAIVYQIYPASFSDSNGDGLGDINGIIARLDYLKDLGVDVIWLSPIFKSPQVDMGYDVSDYCDIHAPYGTVEDVEHLLAELHKRQMKLLLDLVVNHTSDEHPWFVESRASKSSPKRDWYIWRPAKYASDGTRRPPNNWKGSFGGSVWEWDKVTEEYYLHYYDAKQPDLNFENPEMRTAIYKMMKFWLDKGCDGFRMDVIGRISKDLSFPDAQVTDPKSEWQDFPRKEGPRVHEFIREMHDRVLSKYDILTVGELNHHTPEMMLRYVHPDRREIQMGFSFDHVNIGLGQKQGRHIVEPWRLPEFKAIIARWQALRDAGGWHALYLENHDQPRSISRFANDSPKWRASSGKLLCMLHTTLFGTVYLHQGQEIGLINIPKDWPLNEWKDVQTQNIIRSIQERGEQVREKTEKVFFKARDNGRTPMQWSDEPHAGFSSSQPWMRIPDDYKTWNVALQEKDPDSLLSFWKDMLAFRKREEDILVYGTFELLAPEDEDIFAFVRGNNVLVVLNFSEKHIEYSLPRQFSQSQIIKATRKRRVHSALLHDRELALGPYEGVMLQKP
ncbi:alpha-glucosidase [Cryptococcus neoformans var. grubii Br795]|nr:alpha-glucosidase [Cryptococcus neoformans var. grubii Br795]